MVLWARSCRKRYRWTGKSWRDRSSTENIWPRPTLGAQDVANPVSHVAYGYATQVCILNDDGTIKEIDAAHFVGKAINPLNCEGCIEGGVATALGHTDGALPGCRTALPAPNTARCTCSGPDKRPFTINSILVEKRGPGFCGAIGIGDHHHPHGACRGRGVFCPGWGDAPKSAADETPCERAQDAQILVVTREASSVEMPLSKQGKMNKHIFDCGEKGVGKSTLIQRSAGRGLPDGGRICTKMDENTGEVMHPIYLSRCGA